MNDHKIYYIETVGDFLKLLPEKRIEAGQEFVRWLELLSKLEGITVVVADPVFVWIDDGKKDVTINMRVTK
jgi:hypothetical protein